MRRAAALAALVVAAAAAPDAVAQDARRPVSGGADLASAPVVGPGRYLDRILRSETSFYAVDVRAGQQLSVRFAVDGSTTAGSDSSGLLATGTLVPEVLDPLLQVVPGVRASRQGFDTDGSQETTVVAPRVVTLARAAAGRTYLGPGRYYVGVTSDSIYASKVARVELPLQVDVTLRGTPAADPDLRPVDAAGSDPLSLPGRAVAAAGTPAATSDGDEDAGTSTATRIAGGVAGLLVGLLAGAIGVRALRRRG